VLGIEVVVGRRGVIDDLAEEMRYVYIQHPFCSIRYRKFD
jgi:hypothetical protein